MRPGIANGHIGTIVFNPDFHVNGFYNGYLTDTMRVLVPNWIAFRAQIDGQNRDYFLDTRSGIFTEKLSNTSSGINVTTVMYANMADKHYLVTEITLNVASPLESDVNVIL